MAHHFAGLLHCLKGDWSTARSRGLGAFRTANNALELPRSGCLLRLDPRTRRRGERGAYPAAGRRAARHARPGQGTLLLPSVCLPPSRPRRLLLGLLDEARGLAERSLEYSLSSSAPGPAAHALLLLGDIAIHPDRFNAESGEAHYRQALALAEPRGMRPLLAHYRLGLGKLYRRTGKRQEAREYLATASAMYRDMDMRFWLEKAEAEISGV
jgi:tetratricopeptide (TPR) repeat protein